jgi:REP element-mobilizing transposase RayT
MSHPCAQDRGKGRPLRIDDPNSWYHVVNRGAARQTVFCDDRDRIEFTHLLGVMHERFAVNVHAFCLMTNHYHLLLECPDGGLSSAMHLLGSVFVRHHNERVGRDGPLFKDRFYANQVRSEAYLRRLVTYIHRNPLAIVDEARLTTYRWSSLRSHLRLREPPIWLRTDAVRDMFGGTEALAASTFGGDCVAPTITDASDLDALISLMIDEYLGDEATRSTARTVSMLLLDRLPSELANALRADLAFTSINAERIARCRANQRAAADPRVRAVVDAVLNFSSCLARTEIRWRGGGGCALGSAGGC